MSEHTYQDVLNTDTLRRALGALAERLEPIVQASTDSTNADAKRCIAEGCRYALIAAESQTAGRGRMGRSFYSPDQTGAYFSILYSFSKPPASAVTVTSAAAVAVMRAIRRVCQRQVVIKWVNDLYLNGKKVCGILAESVFDPSNPDRFAVVIGIGINLRGGSFPSELAQLAGTLESDASRADLIAAVTEELLPFLDDPSDRSWLADYRQYSCILGEPISWSREGRTYCGTAIDIDDCGALLVRRDTGELERLFSGEISVRARN